MNLDEFGGGGLETLSFRGTNNPSLIVSSTSALSEKVRLVKGVNRDITPHQLLSLFRDWEVSYDSRVTRRLPKSSGNNIELVLFPQPAIRGRTWFLPRVGDISTFTERGLLPADPFSVAVMNLNRGAGDIEVPHCTLWESGGRWCVMTFDFWKGSKLIDLNRAGRSLDPRLWLVGMKSVSHHLPV